METDSLHLTGDVVFSHHNLAFNSLAWGTVGLVYRLKAYLKHSSEPQDHIFTQEVTLFAVSSTGETVFYLLTFWHVEPQSEDKTWWTNNPSCTGIKYNLRCLNTTLKLHFFVVLSHILSVYFIEIRLEHNMFFLLFAAFHKTLDGRHHLLTSQNISPWITTATRNSRRAGREQLGILVSHTNKADDVREFKAWREGKSHSDRSDGGW